MPYQPATPCNLPKQQVMQLAESVSGALDYVPGARLDPFVTSLGGRIDEVSNLRLGQTQDGSIRVEPDSTFIINLADDVGLLRKRFTIAHELGHFFLHFIDDRTDDPQERVEGMQAERYGSGQVEWEANWFASAFLMPTDAFIQAHNEKEGYLADIANKFRVSLPAANYRAKYLKLETW